MGTLDGKAQAIEKQDYKKLRIKVFSGGAVKENNFTLKTPSLSLVSESPGTDDTPTLKVTNLNPDATLMLYKDSSCGENSGSGSSVSAKSNGNFNVPSDLEASYGGNYYSVQQTLREESSICSEAVYYLHPSPPLKWNGGACLRVNCVKASILESVIFSTII